MYLRGWAEWLHSSLIVTEGPESAVAHIGLAHLRPGDPDIVAQRVDQRSGGSSVRATAAPSVTARPYGRHVHEVFWEVERYQAPPEKAEPDLLVPPAAVLDPRRPRALHRPRHSGNSQPPGRHRLLQDARPAQHRSDPPRAGLQRLLHADLQRIRSTHDLALVPDFSGATARANHIAFRVDQRLDVERAAEAFLAPGTPIEFGPGSTASTRSPTSTCASRAASAWRSTPAGGELPA